MNTRARLKTLVGVVLLLTGAAACSHASKYVLQPGPETPAAKGVAEMSTGKNKNTEVTLTVDFLPLPSALGGASTFVVWITPAGGNQQPTPVGALKINDNRHGEIKFITPHQAFDLTVTAESSPAPSQPSQSVVLSGHISGAGQG